MANKYRFRETEKSHKFASLTHINIQTPHSSKSEGKHVSFTICLTDCLINKSTSPTYIPPTTSAMTVITNILGFPFEQGPSTFQVYSPPPPAKTVHHHPAHCNTIQQSHHQYQDGSTTKTIKSEPVWNDQPCPNIEINNGILCASEGGFGRRGRNSRGADHRRLT